MTNELPILKTTEMLTVRNVDGRQAFTYQDLAEGFQVDPARVRNQFSRNSAAWEPLETGVYQNGTGAESRWFTARGAMRFCRYIKSGRADALYNHLLDLWEAERAGVAIVRDPLTEVDMAARSARLMSEALLGRVIEINQELGAITGRLDAINPQAIAVEAADIETARRKRLGELRGDLAKLVELIVASAKKLPPEDLMAQDWNHFSKTWKPIHRHVGVNRIADYVTAEQFERAIFFARHILVRLGVEPPTQLRLVG